MKKLLVIFTLLFAQNAKANSMEDFWESLGGMSNYNSSEYISGQKSGHLALGSLHMRSKVTNAQLASIQLPSIKGGCGGIDVYAGGFSFIKSDQLIALMKSIGSNAPGALFQLAIDNMSPKIGSTIKYFQNVARAINDLNINSCSAAKALISNPGGVYNTAKSHACRVGGAVSNRFQDAAEARERCTSGGDATSTFNSLSKNMKDQFPAGDINIAFKSIKDSGLMIMSNHKNQELVELLISLSGTIIINDGGSDNSDSSVKYISPMIYDDTTLTTILEGSEFTGYGCNDYDECLVMRDKKFNFGKESSFMGRVQNVITNVSEAIRDDDESKISSGSYKILKYSTLPIYNILRINSSYFNKSDSETMAISEFLAMDILYGYLKELNSLMGKASTRYNNNESYRKIFKDFFDNQAQIRRFLDQKRDQLSNKVADKIQVLQRAQKIEELLKKKGQNNINYKSM